MNSRNIAPRIFSFVMAALITATMLTTIDTLARGDLAANSLMAQAVTVRQA
jgi:hypothetical protein